MKKIILHTFIFAITLGCSLQVYAENDDKTTGQQSNKWMEEVRNFKHSFLVKETEMTEEQSEKFIPLYTEMEDKVYQANREARALEQDLSQSQDDASDDQYLIVATALSQVKQKESEIENQYFSLFAEILSKKQLFLLKRAENRFAIEMLNHNKRSKTEQRVAIRKAQENSQN